MKQHRDNRSEAEPKSEGFVRRTFPRLTIRALLLGVCVIAVGMQAWASWPDRTANRFVAHLNASQWDESDRFLDDSAFRGPLSYLRLKRQPPTLQLKRRPRSFGDLLTASRRYELASANCQLRVRRGKVVEVNWIIEPYFTSGVPYFR